MTISTNVESKSKRKHLTEQEFNHVVSYGRPTFEYYDEVCRLYPDYKRVYDVMIMVGAFDKIKETFK